MKDFAGRTAFVTGGANGVGIGLVRALLAQGCNVAVADIRGACQVCARRHIHGYSHGVRVVEGLERRVDVSRADVRDGDVAALSQQRTHQTDADTVRAAGDEGRAACKVFHMLPRFWRAVSAAWIGLRNRKLKVRLYSSFSGRSGTAAHIAAARSSTP